MGKLCTDYIEYYRHHFDKWCEDVCGIKLYWWQRVALKMIGWREKARMRHARYSRNQSPNHRR